MQTRATSKRISLDELSKAAAEAAMDPKLWGTLPQELLLKVYTSMELREFYQQRLVCKYWNREACSRRCSTDAIRKPYFVMTQHNENNPHAGIIAYNASAGTWTFKFLTTHYRSSSLLLAFHCWDPVGDFFEPFAVEGIVFGKRCLHPSPTEHFVNCFRFPVHTFLFDVQTGDCILDSVPFDSIGITTDIEGRVLPEMEGSVVGMAVDNSKKPHGVKLIVGTPGGSTRILDSGTATWKAYPSHLIRNRAPKRPPYSPKACVTCDGKMYIWADMDEIQVYSVEEDRWSTLDPPPRSPDYHSCRGLGHWQKEVYAVSRADRFTHPTVWKLGGSHAWEEFEHMPADLWAYLHKPLVKVSSQNMTRALIINHCNEFLLMHVIPTHGRGLKTKPRRHVLFSLASKRWEVVEVPALGMRTTIQGWTL